MKAIADFLTGILWSNALVGFLVVAGLGFTVLSGAVQIRYLKHMFGLMRENVKKTHEGVSSYQALILSFSARLGTGNIAGVATAIALGGPGAVFWMWVMALIGAATSFIECTLAQIYKTRDNSDLSGGPAFYLSQGLGLRWYGALYGVTLLLSWSIFVPGTQSNSIALTLNQAFDIPTAVTASFICAMLLLTMLGGIRRFAQVSDIIVPISALGFMLVGLVVIGTHYDQVPAVVSLIVRSALGFDATFGGIVGAAIAYGVRRGVYSNEAGSGTATHAAAAANVSHPAKQGLLQAFSVYFDTLVVCSITAFMILLTGSYNVSDGQGGYVVNHVGDIQAGAVFVQLSVDSLFQGFGSPFVAICVFFFSFTTLQFYAYSTELNLVRLIGHRTVPKWILRCLLLSSTFYGCVSTADVAWAFGDVGIGLMTWINLIGIVLLGPLALRTLRDYDRQFRAGVDPVFDPKMLRVPRAHYWEERIRHSKNTPSKD